MKSPPFGRIFFSFSKHRRVENPSDPSAKLVVGGWFLSCWCCESAMKQPNNFNFWVRIEIWHWLERSRKPRFGHSFFKFGSILHWISVASWCFPTQNKTFFNKGTPFAQKSKPSTCKTTSQLPLAMWKNCQDGSLKNRDVADFCWVQEFIKGLWNPPLSLKWKDSSYLVSKSDAFTTFRVGHGATTWCWQQHSDSTSAATPIQNSCLNFTKIWWKNCNYSGDIWSSLPEN